MLRWLVVIGCMLGSVSYAAEKGDSGGGGGKSSGAGGIGFNFGVGLPFISQLGVDFMFNSTFGISAGYGLLAIDSGEAEAVLSMPEVLLMVHPFSGSYFIGAGVGKENLEVTATDTSGTNEAKIEVEANTTIVKTGWKWGLANGGFWFGIDASYIKPSNAEKKITAPGVPTTDPNYIDAEEAADDFGKAAYYNITFARFGWLF